MKNTLTGRKFAAPYIAALVVVMLTSATVLAQPTSSPTGGNVDARFSTLGVGVLGSEAFLIGSDGSVSNPGISFSGKMRIKDDIVQDAGYGLYTDYIRGEVYNPGTGTFSTTDLELVGFSRVSVTGDLALGNTVYGIGANPVIVKDPQGFAVENYTTGVRSLTITQDGDLSNLTANPVTIRDDQGFQIKNTFGTVTGVSIAADGDISDSNGPVEVVDTNGMQVTGTGSSTVDLVVNGRIQTGDGASRGGVWVSSDPAEPLFVGNNSYQGIGFYNNGWGLNLAQGGLVGIGTRTPASHLQISNNVGAGAFNDWSDFQLLLYEDGAGSPTNSYGLGIEGNTLAFNSNNYFKFYTDNTERMAILNSEIRLPGGTSGNPGNWNTHFNYSGDGKNYIRGTTVIGDNGSNVGIGTGSPAYKLDVNGSTRTTNMYVESGSEYVDAYGSTGNLYASGNMTSEGNVTAYNGYMRAGSIGRFYLRDGATTFTRNTSGNPYGNACYNEGWWGATPNNSCALYVDCDAGDIVVSVMPGTINGLSNGLHWTYVAAGGVGSTRGYVVMQTDNRPLAPSDQSARALCFSPNG